MYHQQHFHSVRCDAINNDIRKPRHDYFAGADEMAASPRFGKLAETKYRIPDGSPDVLGCIGVIGRDVLDVSAERHGTGTKPTQLHRPSSSIRSADSSSVK